MGCFSFKCKKTGRAINSTSFAGDRVHLFLLKDGKVIEHMYGNYDSYGRVFKHEKDDNDSSATAFSSFEWKTDWDKCVDLMFHPNKSNGMAAILASHWKEGDPYPTTRSEDDPNQGWGRVRDGEIVKDPYHKILVPDREKELTDKYMANPDVCPFCGSDDITADHGQFEGNGGFRDVKCNLCLRVWSETFILSAVTFDADDLKPESDGN